MEERMNQLESLVALQDRTITELSAELFRQQQDLTRLRRRTQTLENKLEQLAFQNPATVNEKPPHW
jgi:SlyX protein